jgi:thiol-disulfide isomerase/thioredoxin
MRGGSVIGVLGLALCGACSNDDNPQTFVDLGSLDASTNCGAGVYPCGPYGTTKNDTARNLEFIGYSDPDNFCKTHKDKTLDTSKLVKLSFASWHLENEKCTAKKRKLLWVMVSAGWCSPCKKEVDAVQAEVNAGSFDERVGIVNVVFEDAQHQAFDLPGFIKNTWIAQRKPSFPVVADPDFKMGAYFDRAATPFNMLVDTSNMKIIHRQVGGDIGAIQAQIDAFFK